jgi:anti-anti-sigma factor
VSSKLRIESRPAAGATVIELHGDVSADGESVVKGAYADAVQAGLGAVLFDLSGTAYINTSGISVLITVVMEAKKEGVPVLVCGASPHYKKVLDLVRFSTFVSMFDDEAAALASLT